MKVSHASSNAKGHTTHTHNVTAVLWVLQPPLQRARAELGDDEEVSAIAGDTKEPVVCGSVCGSLCEQPAYSTIDDSRSTSHTSHVTYIMTLGWRS